MKIHEFDGIPEGFLILNSLSIHTILPGPSLIFIKGEKEPPLFVSTLLHGNETTGLGALQKLLINYDSKKKPLPRSLIIFIGNVSAAKEGVRRLPRQPDYNRIWSPGTKPEQIMSDQVIQKMHQKNIFASIDIHNTSGWNPHYACINKLESHFLHLAKMFSRTLVYFLQPSSVQSRAFANICPSITLECGVSGELDGIDHVHKFLEKCLSLERLSNTPVKNDEIDLYHSVARIFVPKRCRVLFGETNDDCDFCFIKDFDRLNFTELPENTLLGRRFNPKYELSLFDEHGKEVSQLFLTYRNDEIRTVRPFMPSMLTQNQNVIFQDCLGYVMQRYALS